MPVNDDLADDTVRRSVRAIRAGNGIWRELLPILRRVERDLIEIIEDGAPRNLSTRRARRLLDQVRTIIADGAERFGDRLEGRAIELAQVEAAGTVSALDRIVPIDLEFTRPPAALLASVATESPFAGALMRDHLSKWSDDTIFAMQVELRTGIVIGEGIEPLQRRLRRVADIKIRDARTLARTFAAHVVNEARAEIYQANRDVIAAEQWVATLDDRTCLRCAALDNERFEIGRGPRAPLHMNCRCVRVPITRGAAALEARGVRVGTRSAANELNGEAPADMSFPQWLRRQSEETQREVLGATRFRLFQNGTPIDRFVNDENEVIRLDELRV